MKQNIKTYLLLAILLLLFATCKKYPENNLWFKNPKKIYPFQGYITKYEVDGIDSLDLLNKFYGNQLGLNKNFREAKFTTYGDYGDTRCSLIFGGGLSSSVNYEFVKKKKYLNINLSVGDTTVYKKNIFINFDVEWQIIRLAKSGSFKLKTKHNGKNYEIQFN